MLRGLGRLNFGLRKIGDIQAVIVVPPFASGANVVRYLSIVRLDQSSALPRKRGAENQKRATFANILTQMQSLFRPQGLGSDVKEIAFGRIALLPIHIGRWRVGEAFQLAQRLGQHRGIILLRDNLATPFVFL